MGRASLRIVWAAIVAVGISSAAMAADPPPPDASDGWRVMPIRSEQEWNQGWIGGEGEQHMQGICRSPSNPDVIYLSHDVAHVWKSIDGGNSWSKCRGQGISVASGQSIEVDPVNPDIVFTVVDASYNWLVENGYEGLFRSTDGGETFTRVLSTKSAVQRFYQHCIAVDPTSVSGGRALRWYVAFPDTDSASSADGKLYRTEDGGDTWAQVADLTGRSVIHGVWTHPTDGQTVYLATEDGLYVSTARGANPAPLGNLPAGEVSGFAVNPQTPTTLYAVRKDTGLYRSTNSGQTFSLLKSLDAYHVFLNPGHPEVIFLTGDGVNSLVSRNGGSSWTSTTMVPAPGLGRQWKTTMRAAHTGIVPNPNDANEAVAFTYATLWKSTNGGSTFYDSASLFTGYACDWWEDGLACDVADPNRFILFCCDISSVVTDNGGLWFTRRAGDFWNWKEAGLVSWMGMHAGDIYPEAGSQTIVSMVGMYWDTKLVRSTDTGLTWQIVDSDSENHLFVAYNTDHPNIVYSGNKRSIDGGVTFQNIPFLDTYSASIMGMCRARPDTVYAVANPRNRILRSDDAGATWRVYASTTWSYTRLDSKPAFAVDPVDPNKVYTLGSGYDLASFDGTTWRKLNVLALAGGTELKNFVRQVAIDPRHPEIIYAEMQAAGYPYLFRSTDSGTTWQDITGNLSRTGGGSIMVHPLTGDLFHGSAFGTWIYPPPYSSPDSIYERVDLRLRALNWRTLADHGPAGVLSERLFDGDRDPRTAGLVTFRVEVNNRIDSNTVTPAAVTITGQAGGDVSSLVQSVTLDAQGNTLTITLSQPLPDGDVYTISLADALKDLRGQSPAADRDLAITLLGGDVDESGDVTAADMRAVRGHVGEAVDASNARWDLNRDGVIDQADVVAVRGRIGNQLP